MIYATADMNPYIPIDNLSTAHKHYKTHTNLCSTIRDTLETLCNLSTAQDLQHLAAPGGLPQKGRSQSSKSMKMSAARLQAWLKYSYLSRDCIRAGWDRIKLHNTCGTPDNLSSNLIRPFRPYCNLLGCNTALEDDLPALTRFFSPTVIEPLCIVKCKTR